MAVIGAARAFEGPILQALVPGLVPAPLFPRAYALSASATQTATILGPPLGGFLYVAGPSAVYGPAGGLFLAAQFCMAAIRMRWVPPPREPVEVVPMSPFLITASCRQPWG